ncbi:MAG: MmcB family DNA repair protein [Hyphomonas sp.]
MQTQPDPAQLPNRRAAEICRGTLRLLGDLGYFGIKEMSLANNRRADIAAVGPLGDIWMIEVKSSIQDFKSDMKWHEYRGYCDRLSFAVAADFPQELIPPDTGLIVADAFFGAVIREAPECRLAPARRKAMTLRFARLAAARLTSAGDTGWTPGEEALTSPLT